MFARDSAPNDVANHHNASGNAHASLEGLPLRTLQFRYAVDDRERGINGTFRCIFLGLWVTKINEHTIAHELGDKAVKPSDCAGTSVLITPDQYAHLLRVNGVSQCGRTHQIGK